MSSRLRAQPWFKPLPAPKLEWWPTDLPPQRWWRSAVNDSDTRYSGFDMVTIRDDDEKEA